MSAPVITVVWVSYFSSPHLTHLYDNLKAKASGRHALRFLLIDNSDGKDEDVQAFSAARPDIDLHTIPPHGQVGSWGHAAGLDYAMTQLASPYTLITDPDIHLFVANWDERLIDTLEAQEAMSAGIPYPFWRAGRYYDFPCPIFHFFRTEALLGLNQPWRPFSDNPLRSIYNKLGRQVVRLGGMATRKRMIESATLRNTVKQLQRVFGMVGPDTGYLIRNQANRQQSKRVMFDLVAAHVEEYQHLSAPMRELADYWELYFWDGHPLLTHMYGTQGKMWRTEYASDGTRWRAQIEAAEQGGH